MRKILGLIAGFAILALLTGCAQRSIILVTSYADGSPRVSEMRSAIQGELRKERVGYQFNVFNMDLQAHPSQVWRETKGHEAVVRADVHDADVVMVAGDDAARYFATRLIGKPKRIIFFDITADPSAYRLVPSDQATGVIEDVPVREAVELIQRLAPNARGIAVIADRSLEGDAIVRRIEQAQDLPIRVVDIRRAGTRDEWVAAVRELQTRADALCVASYGSVLTAPGAVSTVPTAELLRLTSELNRLPDVAFRKEAVGAQGVMAAVVTPVSEQAAIATRMAIDVLFYNQRVKNIPLVTARNRATFINAARAAQLNVTIPEDLGVPSATYEAK